MLALFLAQGVHAQADRTRVLLVFDASKSMTAAYPGGDRMQAAQALAIQLTDSLASHSGVELALRIYGGITPYPPGDCGDSRLAVPFSAGHPDTIKAVIQRQSPTGITPIALSLQRCIGDFPRDGGRSIVILITDGIEECDGDPCKAAEALAAAGIALRPFIIGVGIDREKTRAFDCVGPYFDASAIQPLSALVQVVVSQALDPTTSEVDLLDGNGKPTTTDVAMHFHDARTGALRYNVMHTLNGDGRPDTLLLDPFTPYRIIIHTLPAVHIDTAQHSVGIHNTFLTNAAVGNLRLTVHGATPGQDPVCIVREHGSMKTLYAQPFNSSQRYLAGTYDLEILTMPRLLLEGVHVKSTEDAEVAIPMAGRAIFTLPERGFVSLFQDEGGALVHLQNYVTEDLQQEVALQPGKYRVLYRAADEHRTVFSQDRSFSIVSHRLERIAFDQ